MRKRTRKIAVCVECGKLAEHEAKGLCGKCYTKTVVQRKRNEIGVCNDCGQTKRIRAVGKCSNCYRKHSKSIVSCLKCGEEKQHHAKGLCLTCYVKQYEKFQKQKTPKVRCAFCENNRVHHAKGLCAKCYRKLHKSKWEKLIVTCARCGQEKEHMAKGMCSMCYYHECGGRKYRHIRLSRILSLPSTLTNKEWQRILEENNHACVYCGSKENITQDHWIPSSKGGGYTADNIVPSCKSCNSRKNAMTGEEYFDFLERKRLYEQRH